MGLPDDRVRKLTACIGAEIFGVDLAKPLATRPFRRYMTP